MATAQPAFTFFIFHEPILHFKDVFPRWWKSSVQLAILFNNNGWFSGKLYTSDEFQLNVV
ncbi:hypothetical protein A4R89_08090 [Acetobacter ascendens]|nr:hypothetical protein A4R89_08090 [Acetobacter ascendens]